MAQLKNKNIDFVYAARRRSDKESERIVIRVVLLLIPLVLIVMYGNYFFNSFSEINKEKTQIAEIDTYVNSAEIKEKLASAKLDLASYEELSVYMSNRIMSEEITGQNFVLTSDMIYAIIAAKGATINVNNFSYKSGVFSFDCYSANYRDAVAMTAKLKATNIWTDVIYNGFDENTYAATVDAASGTTASAVYYHWKYTCSMVKQ